MITWGRFKFAASAIAAGVAAYYVIPFWPRVPTLIRPAIVAPGDWLHSFARQLGRAVGFTAPQDSWPWQTVAGLEIFLLAFLILLPLLRAALGAFAPRRAEKSTRGRKRNTPRRQVRGVRVNSKFVFPQRLESRHVLAVGTTGSGKSQILRSAAKSARRDGAPAILPVIERSMFEHFYRPGCDVLLNPFDRRGVAWSPLAEIEHVADADFIAGALVPPGGGAESEEWRSYARSILAATLAYCWRHDGTNADVRRLIISAPPNELAEVFAGTEAEALLQDGADKMLGSARAIAGNVAAPLGKFDPRAGCDSWSIRGWVEQAIAAQDAGDKYGWLWISAPGRQKKAMLPILSAASSIATENVLAARENEDRRIYFIFDEMGALPSVAGVEDVLIRGRKYGLRCFGAVQSVAQLRDDKRYGPDGAKALLGCFGTLFLFRSADHDSAEWVEKTLGQTHVTRDVRSTSSSSGGTMAAPNNSRTSGTSQQHSIESAVLGSQVNALRERNAYVRLAGHIYGPIRVDYVPLRSEHPFFIAREDSPQAPHAAQPQPPSDNESELPQPSADDAPPPEATNPTDISSAPHSETAADATDSPHGADDESEIDQILTGGSAGRRKIRHARQEGRLS
jgi:hypothetical protein